jgi:hypothetical protein
MLIYVAGPYRADTPEEKDANVARAEVAAVELLKIGHSVICPHLNNRNLESFLSSEVMLESDFQQITRCDALYVLKGWEDSEGTKLELALAKRLKIPEYHEGGGYPPLHLTEERAPMQCRKFAEILGTMYRLHLSKNKDYSPANILGTGFLGVVVRLWDKSTRLMNLSGFPLKLEMQEREPGKVPEHEALEDTLYDMAVYAIIGLLVRAKAWGK